MVPVKRWGGQIIVIMLLTLGGRRSSSQPESLPLISFSEKDATVFFVGWKQGPIIMICCDIAGAGCGTSDGYSGPPPVRQASGSASARDGRRMDWILERTAGQSAKFWVNGKEYDLSRGTLFLVKTKAGKTEVEQLDRDLSAVQPDQESCKKFAQEDPAVSMLIGAGGGD
jgi:hypothetical protein